MAGNMYTVPMPVCMSCGLGCGENKEGKWLDGYMVVAFENDKSVWQFLCNNCYEDGSESVAGDVAGADNQRAAHPRSDDKDKSGDVEDDQGL